MAVHAYMWAVHIDVNIHTYYICMYMFWALVCNEGYMVLGFNRFLLTFSEHRFLYYASFFHFIITSVLYMYSML